MVIGVNETEIHLCVVLLHHFAPPKFTQDVFSFMTEKYKLFVSIHGTMFFYI